MHTEPLTAEQEELYTKATRKEILQLLEQMPAHCYFQVLAVMKAACRHRGDQHPDEILLLDMALSYGLGMLNPKSAQHEVDEYVERFSDNVSMIRGFLDRHPEVISYIAGKQ